MEDIIGLIKGIGSFVGGPYGSALSIVVGGATSFISTGFLLKSKKEKWVRAIFFLLGAATSIIGRRKAGDVKWEKVIEPQVERNLTIATKEYKRGLNLDDKK